MIVIIIGIGFLTSVILFIFAKRQIMRFTIRSRRGPHVPVGSDAKKDLRKEIERRLDCIQKIVKEPKLLWEDDKYILKPDQKLPPYYYRMKAVDDVKVLEREIARNDGSVRHPHDSLRSFLMTTLSLALNGSGQRMIHQFCDSYESARHDPNEFGSEEYDAYHRILLKLLEAPPPQPHLPLGSTENMAPGHLSKANMTLTLRTDLRNKSHTSGSSEDDENEILTISHIDDNKSNSSFA
uniref:NICE-3 family protein n=1 Tax=Megaselia scalaris TaxID=36166 RepID=T1H272_MEGSC